MVTVVTLLQQIYDELLVFVNDNTSVSTAEDHVGVLNRTKDITTPFFGFEWTVNPNAMGMGGNVRNGAVSTDGSGNVDSVEKIRDYQATIDFGVVVDGDSPRTRDEYLAEIQNHFAPLVDNASDLHSDVRRVREAGAFPSGGGDGRDVGFRISYTIEFCSSSTVDIPAAETIDWDVDAEGTDAYPENY